MIKVLEFMQDILKTGRSVAMVVLTESDANTPGKTGAIMAVLEDGTSCGTVGGGTFEFEVTKDAVACLKSGKGLSFDRNLNKEYGMICGGVVKGHITVLNPGERLILYGGGHVSQVVAKIAELAGLMVVVVEDRPEFQSSFSSTVQYHTLENPLDAVELLNIRGTDFCIIITRGHTHDKEILRQLAPKNLAYLGMIGSVPKVTRTYKALIEEGIKKEDLQKVYSPVGLNIDSDELGEIGVSIVAEVLSVKNKGDLRHRTKGIADNL